MSDTNIFSATGARKLNVAIFLKRLHSRDHGVKKAISIMSTGLPRPRLARSAHRGRMKLLKGKCIQVQRCSKPTHDHVASL